MLFEGPGGPGNGERETRGPLLRNVSAVMMVLAAVAVFLRLLVRKVSRTPILLDDILIILALPFTLATAAEIIFGVVYNGFGQHFDPFKHEILMNNLINCLRGLYVFTICYVISLNLIKFSFLAFIYRVFHVQRMKLPIFITALIIGLSSTASLLTCIFSCRPIYGFWDILVPSYCINPQKFYWGDSIPAIVTDIMILLLPMPMIWKLQISRSRKWAVSGVFLIGVFVVICHVARFVNLMHMTDTLDVTWELSFPALWSTVSLHVGICCACLPSMWSLFKLHRKSRPQTAATFNHSPRTWPGSKSQISPPKLLPNTSTSSLRTSTPSINSPRPWRGNKAQVYTPKLVLVTTASPLPHPGHHPSAPGFGPDPPPKDYTSHSVYSYCIYPPRAVLKNYMHGHIVPLSKFNELREPEPEPRQAMVAKQDWVC